MKITAEIETAMGLALAFRLMIAILLSVSHSNCSDIQTKAIVVRDLLQYINRPLEVSLDICSTFGELEFGSIRVGCGNVKFSLAEEKLIFVNTINAHSVIVQKDGMLNILERRNDHHSLFIVDLACQNVVRFLLQTNQRTYLNSRWIILNTNVTSNEESEFLEIFDKLPILVSSEVFYFIDAVDHVDIKQGTSYIDTY